MTIALPFPCPLELHARYGSLDISAALGLATLDRSGQTGVGVLHAPELNAYAMLITFQKTEREFSPSTIYVHQQQPGGGLHDYLNTTLCQADSSARRH